MAGLTSRSSDIVVVVITAAQGQRVRIVPDLNRLGLQEAAVIRQGLEITSTTQSAHAAITPTHGPIKIHANPHQLVPREFRDWTNIDNLTAASSAM